MSELARVRRKVMGFFVDDAFLETAIVMAVLFTGLCRLLFSGRPLLAGGCLLALALSVSRATGARDGT